MVFLGGGKWSQKDNDSRENIQSCAYIIRIFRQSGKHLKINHYLCA